MFLVSFVSIPEKNILCSKMSMENIPLLQQLLSGLPEAPDREWPASKAQLG